MLLYCGAGEDSWESLGDQTINPKGNQPWIFIGRTDAEAEAPILWPPDVKSWLIGKDPDAGKDWGQEEKGTTEDEMVGWHHWFNGCEFEQTPGESGRQGILACYSPWGHRVRHDFVTEQQQQPIPMATAAVASAGVPQGRSQTGSPLETWCERGNTPSPTPLLEGCQSQLSSHILLSPFSWSFSVPSWMGVFKGCIKQCWDISFEKRHMVCHIHAPNEYTIQPTTYVGHIGVVIYKNENSICPPHLTEVASGLGQVLEMPAVSGVQDCSICSDGCCNHLWKPSHRVLWYHMSSLKSAMVRIFTPWKWASVTH